MEPTLVLFCRRPAPGTGKQRLARALSPADALAAADLLLAAAVEDAAAWAGPVIIAPAEFADVEWAASLLPGRATVMAQAAGNLGARLMAVDREARRAGHDRLFFIGSDAPALTTDFYAQARRALGGHDVLLADARDGGVTLMANGVPWPPLEDLPWSTGDLGNALAGRCQATGLKVARILGGYDVDVVEDLAPLARDLAADGRPARQRLGRWLAALGY